MASYEKDIWQNVCEMTIEDEKAYYFPLKMIADKKTEMYVKFAKVILILQGPYTDERSLVPSQVVEKFKSASRIISDNTWRGLPPVIPSYEDDYGNTCIVDERAFCKVPDTEEYHSYFQTESRRALEKGNNLLVIDSSLLNKKQTLYYAALAQEMQYVTLVVPPLVTGQVEGCWPETSQAASLQNDGALIQSYTQFQHLFCGWFLHDVDSFELRHEAKLYLQDCIEEIPCLKQSFSRVQEADVTLEMDTETFVNKLSSQYFKLQDKWQDIAYCCTKVFSKQPDSMNEYFKKDDVVKNYGKMSKLIISGFVFSPHMVAARVKLSFKQKNLWNMVDELDENSQVPILYPSALYRNLKTELPKIEVEQISTKSAQTMENSHQTCPNPIDNIPNDAKGKGCHIVLGRAPSASFKEVDYGVQCALKRLSRAKYSNIEVLDLERCVVRRIGKYWLVDLKEMRCVDGFFASCIKPIPFNAVSRDDPTNPIASKEAGSG